VIRGAVAVALAASAFGCAASRPPLGASLPETTHGDWTRVRQRLAIERAHAPEHPFVEEITVAMREPRTKRVFEARGALAIDPHKAMRMVLVGPGGTTALDVWVTDARWRFVVPAIAMKRSGGADPDEARGLPIGFFRWWMLHPLDGRLLSAWMTQGDSIYLLRDGAGTVLMRDHVGSAERHVLAMRREAGTSAELEWIGRALTPHEGDRARYVDLASGLEVEILVNGIGDDAPDPEAFDDPDAPAPKGTDL
jgi:hypothetical protein